jgi:HrpA-like RNA helicase
MPPTLLQRGSLRGFPETVPIDHITQVLRHEMPQFGKKIPSSLRDRVYIAKSETGSGKSTVLPAHVFRLLRSVRTSVHQPHTGRSVFCTQPRVLTAVTLARDMASSPHYPELFLPDPRADTSGIRSGTVGFQTSPITDRPPQGLVYATAGILLAQLRGAATKGDFSEIVSKYAFIIIDEAHERSLDIDSVLMLLKQLLLYGLSVGGEYARQLPIVILASATISVEVYAKFFDLLEPDGQPSEANWFHVVGRQHGIEDRWPEVGCNDYPAAAVAAVIDIHIRHSDDPADSRDILVFMPGTAETRKVVTALELKRESGELNPGGPVVVLAINREAVNKETAAFQLVKAPLKTLWRVLEEQEIYAPELLAKMRADGLTPRRVVVATVVAETGLTIETLRYVVDPGWQRGSETYQPFGVQGLITRPAAQSRIHQRKGRAGRLFPGVFVPLYTRKVFEELPAQQLPDIVNEGASQIILDIVLSQQVAKRLALIGGKELTPEMLEFRVEDLDMLDPPPTDAFASAISTATLLGFLAPDAPLLGRPPPPTQGEKLPEVIVGRGMGLTSLGRTAALFPRLSLPLRRLLLAAPSWGSSISDLATIAAVCLTCGQRGLASLLNPRTRRRAQTPAKVAEALLTGLTEGLPTYLRDRAAQARGYFQDSLLEGLFIFEGFSAAVTRLIGEAGPELLHAARQWCDERGLSSETLFDIVRSREAILEELIVVGLNPFWGADKKVARSPPADLPARVQNLKRCIYDAFRANELAPTESKRTGRIQYENEFGLVVNCPDLAQIHGEGHRLVSPLVAIAAITALQGGRTPPLRWELRASLVSVLDTAASDLQVAPAPSMVLPAPAAE